MIGLLQLSLDTVEGSTALLAVLLAATAGTGILFACSVVAYARRRGRRYLFISVAVGALWVRSLVGIGTVLGHVSMPIHHLVEHSLDLFIAILILYVVYAHAPGSLPSTDRE